LSLRSINQLKSYLKKNPHDARAWYELSVAYANDRNLPETHEALKRALSVGPTEEELCVQIGMSLEAMNDGETALKAFARAGQLSPTSQAGHRHLGAALLKLGRPHNAVEPLRRAAKLSNYASEDCLSLAIALEQSADTNDKVEEAMAYYHLAADSGRDNLEAHRQLGRMLSKVGHHAGAIRAWRRVVELAPGDLNAIKSLGIALSTWGKHDDAIALLTEVVRERPESAEAYADLGIAMTRGGLHEPAIRALQRAIALRPSSPHAHLNLGVALMGAGRAEEAMASFWEVIALAPDWSVAHFNLGMALRDLGDLEGARDALNRASTLDPQDQDIQAALRGVLLALSGISNAETATAQNPAARGGGGGHDRSGSITGELNVFGLPDLLEFLKVRQASGVLRVNSSRGVGELMLERGDLIGATTPTTRGLTDHLLAIKAVTAADLEIALEDERARNDSLYAAIVLVEDGVVSGSKLKEAVWSQIRMAIKELVSWNEGDFRYLERPAGEGVHPVLAEASIDTRRVLLEVMTQLDEANR
jgi:tetratricopeptide (TPR) repeat protein